MVRKLFEDERSLYRLFLVVATVVGIGIGMRTPTSWLPCRRRSTVATRSYRSLFGELCRNLNLPIWNHGFFMIVAFILLGLRLAVA